MITVKKVEQKNAVDSTAQAQKNEEVLRTGAVKEVKKSYVPWILLGLAALGFGYWFYRKNKGGTNEGVQG